MRLGVTFPNHWSIKNLLHSGVMAQLEGRGIEWVGIADPCRIPALRHLARELGLTPQGWHPYVAPPEPAPARRLRRLQKALLFQRDANPTEAILLRSRRGSRTALERAGSWALRALILSGQADLALRRWGDLRRAATPGISLPAVDALLATNPFDFREDPLVKAAELAGLPTYTMIPSWDNLTSKGVLFSTYDGILVWNDGMASELIRLYRHLDLPPVAVTGLPRFGAYLGRERCPTDPPTILFANTATQSFPDQPAVARHLAEALPTLGARLHVRCHPHDEPGGYAFLRQYSGVTVWPEERAAFGVDGAPPADDLNVLAETLLRSSVCVNSASTIALDAAACDVPVVSVAYDGDRELPPLESVRSFYHYAHQAPFLASGAAEFAPDRESLLCAVDNALQHPEKRRNERAALAQIALPGDPVQLTAEAIAGWLAGGRRACA